MRPPICEVCNERIDTSSGSLSDGLIAFAMDARTEEFDLRAEQPGFVGHRPNRGWFCTDHVEAARALVDMTLGDAVSALRLGPLEPEPEPRPDEARQVPAVVRRKRRSDAGSGTNSDMVDVDLSVSVDVFELHTRLRQFRPSLMAALGLLDEGEFETRTKRTWNPMDGSREPDCPYSDLVTGEAHVDGVEQGTELETNWWNPNDLANASTRLFIIRRPSPTDFATYICRITGGTGHLGGGPAIVRTLSVTHIDDPAVAKLIVGFAAGLSSGASAS